MTPTGVRLDCAGPVATVTLGRPDVLDPRTPRVWQALRQVARELPGEIRVVVLRTTGADFAAEPVLGGDPAALTDSVRALQQAIGWLRQPDLVTLAAVQGAAVGAGCQLVLACDLRVLAEDARLALPEVTAGLVPAFGSTKRLVELMGYARALELCLTARWIDAATAATLGLANLVVASPRLDAAVAHLVELILAAPRTAVIEIKALLAGAAGRSQPEQERAEREALARCLRDLAGQPE